MPKDIRSFFLSAKKPSAQSTPSLVAKKSRKRVISDSSDDEVQILSTAPPAKKKTVLKETKNVSPDLIETTPSKFFQSKKKASKPILTKKRPTSKETVKESKAVIQDDDCFLMDDQNINSNESKKSKDKSLSSKLKQASDHERKSDEKKSSPSKKRTQENGDKSSSGGSSTDVQAKKKPKQRPAVNESEKQTVKSSPSKTKKASSLTSESTASSKKKTAAKTPQKASPPKKERVDKTVEKSATPAKDKVLADEEQKKPARVLTPKQERYLQFKKMQARDMRPPKAGSKEVPKGADNCFEGLTFVITGVQESLSREEITSLVERYGGKVTSAVSGRTAYLITGEEAGKSKTEKALKVGTKIITEDDFLELIRTKPGKRSKYDPPAATSSVSKPSKSSRSKPSSTPNKSSAPDHKPTVKKEEKVSPPPSKSTAEKLSKFANYKIPSKATAESKPVKTESKPKLTKVDTKTIKKEEKPGSGMMWVDKYKPGTIKQIIGQQGAQSNMNKLMSWLQSWHSNHGSTANASGKKKKSSGSWGGKQDPSQFKAALLSGPPGVGKTTTSTLVCKHLGFTYIEMNASDTRSKRTLKEDVSEILDNTHIDSFFGAKKKKQPDHSKHALIMDEVDGMAGNEDRGGMQELIQLIKSTKIPIICICNDRSSPKMRSLVNYCLDLRFQRPRVEQITGQLMSMCYKEGLKIQAPALQAIIRGCNQDVRQVVHNLNMLKSNTSSVSYDDAQSHNQSSKKDVNIGLFEIARKLLSESSSSSIVDKSNLFFMDYSMIPLFVQENYPSINPWNAKGNMKRLEMMSKAADSIAMGDMVDTFMRSKQSWSMLPTLGLMSSVMPCTYLAGSMSEMIRFPSFFGKLSSTGKSKRLLQELKFHSSVATTGITGEMFNLQMSPYLKYHLVQPLVQQSSTGEEMIPRSVELLTDYDLQKTDFDSICEMTLYPGSNNMMTKVNTKTKTAFTRAYNKSGHLTPYSIGTTTSKKKAASLQEEFKVEGDDDAASSSEDENDTKQDKMIKQKASKAKSSKSSSKASGSKSKSSKAKKPASKKKK